jgi:hypothetical protein
MMTRTAASPLVHPALDAAARGLPTTSPRSMRELVAALGEYEGRRCLWRVPVALLARLAGPALLASVFITTTYLAADAGNFGRVALAAALAVLLTPLEARIRRQRPWRMVVARRLHSYEAPNPLSGAPVLVSPADAQRARLALRRARFNPPAGLRVGQPPADALDLNYQLRVEEPVAWTASQSDEDRVRRVLLVLGRARVRARVAGIDTFRAGW